MAEAIRKLQLFRNDTLLVGSAYEVRGLVDSAYQNGQLLLNDGEPISVRYQETQNGEIKGLHGVAYNVGNDKFIIWGGSGDSVTIETHPTEDEYVTLNYDFNEQTNHYDLTVGANVVMLDDACGCAVEVRTISENVEHLYWQVEPEQGEVDPVYVEVHVGDIVKCWGERDQQTAHFFVDGENGKEAASDGTEYTAERAEWTGLADACDVKSHIRYYDVVAADNTVTVNSSASFDANGFNVTTFSVSVGTENLPQYTIGTTETTSGYLKTYALFKDGVEVANSTIDIPKDFLVKSASVIDVVEYNSQYYDATDTEHENPLPVSAAGPYIDFVINVKSGDPETPEHIYVLLTSLVDVYTAGDGITISTTNVVSAKLSQTQGNQISFDANGGLFVPAGETITDVSTIDSDCLGTAAETPVYYGYVNSQYVVITKTGSDPDTYEYNGQPYTGAVGGPVPCGHRYLVVQTSGGNMYFANNDTSADIHVSNFSIATNSNDEDVLRITMNDTTTYDVLVSDINPVIPDATVDWDTQNDTLSVGTDGLFTQLAIGTIEAYIDNFDCGTFTIGTV